LYHHNNEPESDVLDTDKVLEGRDTVLCVIFSVNITCPHSTSCLSVQFCLVHTRQNFG